ncbi:MULTISPECIES: tubby C-terminal domain-like protein [Staphylococcus]|uniref:tubby C-terminal domain-like protein n=1 Tax=Staphylococcus TaxID=1279 RepID=UPI003C12BA1B
MYKYKVYNSLTTSPSKIENCNNKSIVGSVKKSYSNLIKRVINFIGDGKFYNCFEVYDENNKLIFQSQQINQFKHKNYYVKYLTNTSNTFSIKLIDESKIKIFEKATFSFLIKNLKFKTM